VILKHILGLILRNVDCAIKKYSTSVSVKQYVSKYVNGFAVY